MSDIRGFVQNPSVQRSGNGVYTGLRSTSGGELYTADYGLAEAIEGRMFGCHWGTLTTPLATPGTQVATTLRPQAWLRIPDGTLIIPINIEIVVESTGITTQGEIIIYTAQADVGNGTSTAGTSGPISLNTAALLTSNVTQRQLATGDVTAETALLELKRFSFALSAVNQQFSWNARQTGIYPVLRGPASLEINIGGNAVNFFAQCQWIEWAESAGS